ncbi:methyltransferase, FkbM family [Desulfitobacterium dichloroeliminans LMG P-21439]|uniref:Methyltransferase, FkbM family n=1 Tax=Desulfitobacterium dichloroeliminans (strain LMG P-21439 / DCA1) TaxID=871963 RepID=L0F8Z4_DESDL|nr:FkbM family methyltransferase [Desulfitobacterium dichloroeliminans]AGA70299.1 methyltransferase, FkbM family [Desulfitobacterium dichloroeliminans LMG P-21439]
MNKEQTEKFIELLSTEITPSCPSEIFYDKEILLYGAGRVGGLVYDALTGNGQSVTAFLDIRGSREMRYRSKPVYNLDDIALPQDVIENAIVLLSFDSSEAYFNAVANQLRAVGFRDILHYKYAAVFLYNPLAIQKAQQDILEFADLLEDEASIQVFYQFIKAKLISDFSAFCMPCDEPQYFAKSIKFRKGYQRFVDCGAYSGDSILTGLSHGIPIQSVVCFEPDEKNFSLLHQNMESCKDIQSAICFPCGVADRTGKFFFTNQGTAGSHISECGGEMIRCVSLSEALVGFHPTFIKMDIEGAEYSAILGAKKILVEDKPDLAIAVYHKNDDIWRIPLLIHSVIPEYKFFLRSHGLYGVDTVLYATI